MRVEAIYANDALGRIALPDIPSLFSEVSHHLSQDGYGSSTVFESLSYSPDCRVDSPSPLVDYGVGTRYVPNTRQGVKTLCGPLRKQVSYL